jgi:hypothetical protein
MVSAPTYRAPITPATIVSVVLRTSRFSLREMTESLNILTPVFTVAFSPKNFVMLLLAISRDWLIVAVVLANSCPILSP